MGEYDKNVLLTQFDKICRLCLSQNSDTVEIFNSSDSYEMDTLSYRIKECVTIEVSQNDGLPQNVCRQCFHRLNEYYHFKNHCKQSDVVLRKHLFLTSSEALKNKITEVSEAKKTVEISVDNFKPVKEISSSILPPVKIECLECEDPFSDSDEKPLIEIMSDDKKKKLVERSKVRKSATDAKKPLARGRAPKAKPLCLICHQKFSRFVELIDHQSKMHNMNTSGCDIISEHALEESKVNIDAYAIFKCHICKKEFPGREDLRNHCKTVHDTKVIQPYPCSHCERQFPSWGLLVVHERKHTGEKPYSCDVCGKKNFISQTSLRRHKLMHLKVYSCKECGRDFNCDSALKSHIRCKHTNEKPFLCNICGRSFSLSAILTAHMTSHSSERKYICDICGFASKTSGNHYRHKNIHKVGGAKSFHCETCGKSFDSKLKLSSHQIIHRPVRPHVCKVCSKAFLYKNKLERHILLVHARERPFPCNLCGKKLASKFGLGIHLKTHTRNSHLKLEITEIQQVLEHK